MFYINTVVPNVPFLYAMKISENRKVFWCFEGVEKGYIGNEWVKNYRGVIVDPGSYVFADIKEVAWLIYLKFMIFYVYSDIIFSIMVSNDVKDTSAKIKVQKLWKNMAENH